MDLIKIKALADEAQTQVKRNAEALQGGDANDIRTSLEVTSQMLSNLAEQVLGLEG